MHMGMNASMHTARGHPQPHAEYEMAAAPRRSQRRGTISDEAVRLMAKNHERPMVFPLSNPTSSCEITPAEVYSLTDGRAIVATGSPFDPVVHRGQTLVPSQCNNSTSARPPDRLDARCL